VSEVGTEHADVIASTVTRANYSLGCQLIGDTETRCKCSELLSTLPFSPKRAKTSHPDAAGTAQRRRYWQSRRCFRIDCSGK